MPHNSLFFKSIIGLIITLIYLLMLSINVICTIDPNYLHHDCTRRDNLYTSGSIFEANLNTTLLNVLPVNASFTGYSRHATGNGTDQVYAFSYCRGDVTGKDCRDCVEDAGRTVLQHCEHLKEGIVWYEECTLRYSNRSAILSTEEVTPSHLHHNFSSILKSLDQEKNTFDKLMNGLILQAAKQDEQGKIEGYATEETPLLSTLPQSLMLRAEVQCRPNTVSSPCEMCLRSALKQMNGWSTPMVFLPNCNLRFELFPSPITAPPTSSGGGGSLPRKVLVPVLVAVMVVSVLILSSIVYLIIRYRRKQQQQGNCCTHLEEGEQPSIIIDHQTEHRPSEEGGGASLGVHHHITATDVQENFTATGPSQSAAYNPSQNTEQRESFPEPSAPPLPADTKSMSFCPESRYRQLLEAELFSRILPKDRGWIVLKNLSMSRQWRWFCSKVMDNALPTGTSLISTSRKTSCAFCREDESSTHLLRDCFLVRRIWKSMRLGLIIDDNKPDLDDMSTWFNSMFIYLHDEGDLWTELVATMWAIWLHRNNVVFRGAEVDPREIMKIAEIEKLRWTKVFKNHTKVNNNHDNVHICQIDVWNWGDDTITLILITNNKSCTFKKGDTIIARIRRRIVAKNQLEAEGYAKYHGLKECIRLRRPYRMQLHIWANSSQVANAFCNPFSIARNNSSIYLFFSN